MKQFMPKMNAGITGEKISPEATKEWQDKDGKHEIDEIHGTAKSQAPSVKAKGVDGFDPGKRTKAREAVVKNKWSNENSYLSPHNSSKGSSIKHKTGPMKNAGKGKSGAI